MEASFTQAKTTTFYNIIQEQVDTHFPTRTNNRCSNDKPWMTDKIRNLIHRRQEAHKRGNGALWKSLRNSIIRAIAQAKRTFTSRELSRMGSTNTHSWFSTIKKIAGMQNTKGKISLPGCEHSSASKVAGDINAHFGTICRALPALDTAQLPAYLPAAAPPPSVTRSQVWKELARIKSHKAPGPDNLPNKLLRVFAFEISEPVCNIINTSLSEGVVPTQWKCATIVPVPKINPPPSLDKLRPVSLTSTLAKVAESFVSKWMMEDMAPNLDHRQFGNRKGRSTNHYLVQLVQYAYQALEDGHTADLLTIDYSKAFDRVDATVALRRLLQMDVRRQLLPWVGNFLSGRRHCVKANGAISDWVMVTCGVPQGTKLGPVIFLAMVDDVAQWHVDRWKFVDDITVAACSKPSATSNSVLQETMLGINEHANHNHMLINTAKCNTMRINATAGPVFTPLSLNDTEVPHNRAIKLLGIIIQHNLKWDSQVEAMVMKANSRRYFVTILKRAGVTVESLKKCYCIFIRPVLEYAAPVWHPGLTRKQSDLLEQVQRQCLRTMLPNASYREALHITGLHTLEKRRRQLCLSFAQDLLGSEEFSCWLPRQRRDCHGRVLRNNRKFDSLPSRTVRFTKSPLAYMTGLLNSLAI